MKILVTGGAGYIGSHAVKALLLAGHDVRVFDDLSTGHRDAIDPRAGFAHGSLHDSTALDSALDGVGAVMHFAASSLVGESCARPLAYWHNNVAGSLNLLQAMERAGVRKLVFSSTAATYGIADRLITEETPQSPINPYGSSKLAIETMIREYATANPDFAFAILRYFNVAGCYWGLGERHDPETHLIPIILQAATGQRESVAIFGLDYPTPDGTCVRDYVHVRDLVDAHVVVVGALEPGDMRTYNIGSGTGWSVKQVMDTAKRVTGVDFMVRDGERRPGDPATLVASPQRIRDELGWSTQHSQLEEILADHWSFAKSL